MQRHGVDAKGNIHEMVTLIQVLYGCTVYYYNILLWCTELTAINGYIINYVIKYFKCFMQYYCIHCTFVY